MLSDIKDFYSLAQYENYSQNAQFPGLPKFCKAPAVLPTYTSHSSLPSLTAVPSTTSLIHSLENLPLAFPDASSLYLSESYPCSVDKAVPCFSPRLPKFPPRFSLDSIRQWFLSHLPLPKKPYSVDPAAIEEFNRDLAGVGFAYDHVQDIFYSILNPWQRHFGYCSLYDEAAVPLSMVIDSEPIRFYYAGKNWLIELWKGQYGMTTSAEIGIYYSRGQELNIPGLFSGIFYESIPDEEMLNMSFTLKKNGRPLFSRKDRHWWLTGFKLAEFSEPEELSMDITIELKDRAMTKAFVAALKKLGYLNFHLQVRDKTVSFTYIQPYSPQPDNRFGSMEWLAQQKNQQFCEAFLFITRHYDTSLEKLLYVKDTAPDLYRQVISMGKTEQIYAAYEVLQKFIS